MHPPLSGSLHRAHPALLLWPCGSVGVASHDPAKKNYLKTRNFSYKKKTKCAARSFFIEKLAFEMIRSVLGSVESRHVDYIIQRIRERGEASRKKKHFLMYTPM